MASYGYTFTSGDSVTPTKLNSARTVSDIVNADISATAAIAATKLASDSITNTQIKSDAAIAGTKIAPNFGSQNIVTTGSVGIGTSSPNERLTVVGVNSRAFEAGGSNASIRLAASEGGWLNAFRFLANNGTELGAMTAGGGSQAIDYVGLNVAGSERLRIDSSGFVGIGTASPSTKLEVVGTVTATAFTGNVTGNLAGTASAIADGAVSTAKIVDSAVTDAKIASGVDASKLTTGTLPADRIGSSAITTARINDAAVTPAKLSQPFSLSNSQTGQGLTAIDYAGIPSWVKRITVIFDGVSTNGTSSLCIQIGSGSLQLSGYSSSTVNQAGTASAATTALLVAANSAASATHCGNITLSMRGDNVWVLSGVLVNTNGTSAAYSGGRVTLSGAIDRLRISTVNGTDTFDTGAINIAYEG